MLIIAFDYDLKVKKLPLSIINKGKDEIFENREP
jgi:hypothetical protein